MNMLSVILPSRANSYLQETIDDLLKHAEEEIEIIAVLDGVWPETPLREDKRVRIIHHGTPHNNRGMRASINAGMALAKGKYLMKLDEHCSVDQGFDKKLKADCEDNWVVIPRRYRLLPETWTLEKDGRPPVDYMYLAYPYERPFDKTCGLHGSEWKRPDRKDILIDDTMSWQGSCYFMTKKHWEWLGGLDATNYGQFTQEAQEIGNKTWLGGGRLVVNKKTWYAHSHKGSRGKGYGFSNAQYQEHMKGTERGRLFCIDYWLHNKWEKRVHDFEWLLEKFWPVPTWPENWQEQIKIDAEKDYSKSNEYKGL